jgi:hypothetical protein
MYLRHLTISSVPFPVIKSFREGRGERGEQRCTMVYINIYYRYPERARVSGVTPLEAAALLRPAVAIPGIRLGERERDK